MSLRERLRDPFAPAAVGLAAVAFAGSFTHTHTTVTELGQTGWVAVATALMPEVSVALSVLRIRRGGLPAQVRWAWLVLVTSAAFTLWANLMQAAPGIGGLIVGGWPAWAAIGAAGFIEMGGKPTVPVKPAARPVKATAAKPAPASTPAPPAVEALGELVMELSRAEAAAEGMESPVRRWLSQAAQCLGAAQAEVATRELHAAIGRSTPHATLDVPCSRCGGRTFPPHVRADGSLSGGYYCERDGVVTVESSTGVVVELSDGSGDGCCDCGHLADDTEGCSPALRVVSAVTW